MKAYSQFHDGVLEGIWIDDEMVHVFVRTVEKARFTVVVTGVAMLTAGIFKEGNIILEVLTRDGKEITSEDIDELYDLQSGPAGADQASRLLSEARQRDLTILEISPSYGASCVVLARSVDLLTRDQWALRYAVCTVNRNE